MSENIFRIIYFNSLLCNRIVSNVLKANFTTEGSPLHKIKPDFLSAFHSDNVNTYRISMENNNDSRLKSALTSNLVKLSMPLYHCSIFFRSLCRQYLPVKNGLKGKILNTLFFFVRKNTIHLRLCWFILHSLLEWSFLKPNWDLWDNITSLLVFYDVSRSSFFYLLPCKGSQFRST